MIFDIQRFSTHDGPGIRTVVFLKGCSLRCRWCANPESQSRSAQILFSADQCVGCHACLDPRFGGAMALTAHGVHPVRSRPVPAELNEVCPSLALRVAGRETSVDALVEDVLRDQSYFERSGGGVTFSGGEPLESADLVAEAAVRFDDLGISVAVETCLAVDPSVVRRLLVLPLKQPLQWLVDVKHVDAEVFRLHTGGDVHSVLANLRLVAREAKAVRYRLPLVPGFNDGEAARGDILAFLSSLQRAASEPLGLDLLACHDLAAGKYRQLGRPNPFPRIGKPLPQTVDAWKTAAQAHGFSVTLGG